jgi:hypothetical protein
MYKKKLSRVQDWPLGRSFLKHIVTEVKGSSPFASKRILTFCFEEDPRLRQFLSEWSMGTYRGPPLNQIIDYFSEKPLVSQNYQALLVEKKGVKILKFCTTLQAIDSRSRKYD